MITDIDSPKELVPMAFELLKNTKKSAELSTNIKTLALPHAARMIAEKVIELAEGRE